MAGRMVAVLGGGIGGVAAARALRRRLSADDRVLLMERERVHRFAPSLPWVMTGSRRADRVDRPLGRLVRRGIQVLPADVEEITADSRRVRTTAGEVAADRLVIALGVELAPEELPGFAESAHDVYTLEGAQAAGRALRALRGGRVAVLVSRLPYKCPAAPYETAMLAAALLRRTGARDSCSVDVYTPEPFPMPTAGAAIGEALEAMLAERGIGFHRQQQVERIEAGSRELVFTDGRREGFDLLLGVPPHRAPRPARESGLAAETGFIRVDRSTLETEAEGVFAIGDVTTIPIAGGKFLPKAGVFAHREAHVVAERIAAELGGRAPSAEFDGSGSCFVEMGGGVAGFATGNFYGEDGPVVRMRRPGRRWHLARVALEQLWLRRL